MIRHTMIRQTSLVLLLTLGSAAPSALAQRPGGANPARERESQAKAEELGRLAESEFDRGRESEEERAARREFELERRIRFNALDADDRAALAPPLEEAARFASLLGQTGTGLVRLMPREKPDARLSVRGGGAYYSFAHLVHEYAYGSDIELSEDRFTSGFAGADFGFLFDLGDVALEEVTTETPPVKFMASFTPPPAESEARKLNRRLWEGHQDGWFVYRKRVSAEVGHTYAVRSVSYGMSDVLVAFRVLRREDKGSVVLLWKMLKKFPAPTLERDDAQSARTR